MAGPRRAPTRWTSRRPACSAPGPPWWRRSRARPSEPASAWRAWPTSGSAAPQARFAANFARIGYHHILGLTITLPAIVGQQHALSLLYTGRRLKGEEALVIGLCDRLVAGDELRSEAHAMAAEIAASAPLAVRSIRQTMRAGLADRFRAATEREAAVQQVLESTWDLTEGVRAARERRPARFEAR